MIFSWLFEKLFGGKKKKAKKSGRKTAPKKKSAVSKAKYSKANSKPLKKGALKKDSPKQKTSSAGKAAKVNGDAKEEYVGEIIHFFPKVKAGVIHVKKGFIKKGDGIHIKGSSTNFKQKVLSMQIQRKPVESAGKGQQTGILFKYRVRIGDKVFKIKP